MMQAKPVLASLALLAAVGVGACRHENAGAAPSTGSAASSGADAGIAAADAGTGGTSGTAGNVSTRAQDAGHAQAAAGSGGRPASEHTPDTNTDTDTDAGPTQAPGLSFETAMQTYSGWTQATAEPQAISVEIFSLCRAPSDAEEAFVESEHGKSLYLQDWLNPAAVSGQEAKGQSAFASGAAIVKQKLARDASGKLAVVALGIMIKRDRGFDATHGDWEFGYWEPQPGLKAGPAEASHCGGCHASSPTDYVFLDQSWRIAR